MEENPETKAVLSGGKRGTENLSQKLRQCAIILWNMELTEND